MSTGFLDRLRYAPVLADGAMGTEIFARGVTFDRCFDDLNLSRPDMILDIHRLYVEAGAEVLETNTFGANHFRLIEHDFQAKVAEINVAGVRLARMAADESRRRVYVAGSAGPLGVRLAPLGRVQPAQARQAFLAQIRALREAGVDLLILETFSDLNEIREAILAAKEVAPDVPLVAQMTFTEDGRTPLGDSAEAVARALLELKVDVIGANCSVGPARLLPVVNTMANLAGGAPVSVMPNAGWPQRAGPRIIYPATPDYFADFTRRFLFAGAAFIGGCCGTTPKHIRVMRAALDAAIVHRISAGPGSPIEVVSRAPLSEPPGREEPYPPTRLQEKLARGEFVVAVEVDPPKGHNAGRILEAARELGKAGKEHLAGVLSRLAAEPGDDGETAEALDEDIESLVMAEEQGIALPMADLHALSSGQGAGVDEQALGNGADVAPAALTPRALLLAPAQVLVQLLLTPQGRLIDEAVDGFMVDHASTLLNPQSPGDLLRRQALLQKQKDVPLQATVQKTGPSAAALTPGLVAPLRHVGQISSRNGIATQLAAHGCTVPPQAPGDLSLRKPLPLPLVDQHALVGRKVDIRFHTTLLSS